MSFGKELLPMRFTPKKMQPAESEAPSQLSPPDPSKLDCTFDRLMIRSKLRIVIPYFERSRRRGICSLPDTLAENGVRIPTSANVISPAGLDGTPHTLAFMKLPGMPEKVCLKRSARWNRKEMSRHEGDGVT
jgi:hypothetical protein